MALNVLRCWADIIMSSESVGTVELAECCFTSTETIRLIRDGEKGGRGHGDE